jgi:hypothetical protein
LALFSDLLYVDPAQSPRIATNEKISLTLLTVSGRKKNQP